MNLATIFQIYSHFNYYNLISIIIMYLYNIYGEFQLKISLSLLAIATDMTYWQKLVVSRKSVSCGLHIIIASL